MEVNGQCHAPAALSPLPNKYEAGCVSESLDTYNGGKNGTHTGHWNTIGEQNVARVMSLSVAMFIY